MSKSALTEQMQWYSSQPIGYRRLWWEWARTQPNFKQMLAWARSHEKDESVLRMMQIWSTR